MRRTLAIALIAAPLGAGFFTAPASAYCDDKYYPLCTNDCQMQPPDVKDPWGSLFRFCPE